MRSPIKLRSNGRHSDSLPVIIPATPPAVNVSMVNSLASVTRVWPELGKLVNPSADGEKRAELLATETQAFTPPWVTPLPKRPSFRDRCEPAFAPGVSASLRRDFADLPAFRATVRNSGLAGLHYRATARSERNLP